MRTRKKLQVTFISHFTHEKKFGLQICFLRQESVFHFNVLGFLTILLSRTECHLYPRKGCAFCCWVTLRGSHINLTDFHRGSQHWLPLKVSPFSKATTLPTPRTAAAQVTSGDWARENWCSPSGLCQGWDCIMEPRRGSQYESPESGSGSTSGASVIS